MASNERSNRASSPSTDMPSELGYIAPCFIVHDVMSSIAFYRDRLGFEVVFLGPDDDPYFAIVKRGVVRIFLKHITPEVQPIPNHTRHGWAPWDAFIQTSDPDALAEEFAGRGVQFHAPLHVNSDNLRGFDIEDVDGYVLYFGTPV